MNQQVVDDLPGVAHTGLWFGCIVPKRHAKRAVTRNLIKRQMRSAVARHAGVLAPGLWLLRLRVGFPAAQFVSAASAPLAAAARHELEVLLKRATA